MRLTPCFAALLALAPLGCAAPLQIRSTDLAARAAASPIEAQRDFAKHRVIVEGVVQQTSLADRRSVVATAGPYGWGAEAHQQHESIPVVILEPGSVACYFEPNRTAFAATIKGGQGVRLECTVDSFRIEGGQVYAILASCESP
jgi:hypothetical protein